MKVSAGALAPSRSWRRHEGVCLEVICRCLGMATPDGQQVIPFLMYGRELGTLCGIRCDLRPALTLELVRQRLESSAADVVLVMVSWQERAEDVVGLFQSVRWRDKRPVVIFLDWYAPTCSPHFTVLPYVDLYVKRQVLRERAEYQREFKGGFVLTDFLAGQLAYDLRGWHFGSVPDPAHAWKIVAGWNLGITPRYRRLLAWTRGFLGRRVFSWKRRGVDLNRRLAPAADDAWYGRYRRDCLRALQPLEARWRCSGIERLPPRRYLWEMLQSKIVVSPFGWGELCFRDYEAVACGALLVKPSMAHLETSPDVFLENQTYVPVKWDLSNLAEVCEHYLSRPGDAQQITRRAQQRLWDYYEGHGFARDILRILDALGHSRPSSDATKGCRATPEPGAS